jgi:hypothetical protein
VVDKALAKAPADRFQTVAEFVAALERAAVAPESGEYVPARARARRRWWWGAGGGVLVVSATVAIWAPWVPPVRLDSNKVMGFPLRTQGTATRSDADVVMQGIGNALVHTEPLKWLDPWGVVEPAFRENPGAVPAATVRRLALRHGARFYVTGVVAQVGDSQAVTLELYDARADSFVSREMAGGRQAAAVLGLRAVNGLLPRLVGRSTHVSEAWLNPRRPAAVVNWLQGEVAYRHARYEEAMGFYRRALEEDSGLVVAALKGAITAAWINEHPAGDSLVRLALRRERDMPVRNARMAHGLGFFFDGDGDSALAWFRSVLAADPDWSEGWYAVGEVYLHLLPAGTALDSLAREAFARATQLDSGFAPAIFHLTELTLLHGDGAAGERLLRAYRQASADSAQRAYLAAMLACVAHGPGSVRWDAIAARYPTDVVTLGRRLAGGMRWPDCATRAFEAVLRSGSVSGPDRWSAAQGVHNLYVALGASERARAFTDSLLAHGYQPAQAFVILDATLGLERDDRAASVLLPFERPADRTSGALLEFLGPWYVHRREVARMDSIQRAFAALAVGNAMYQAFADAMAARLALVRGDTVGAIRRLERLHPVVPSSDVAWGVWEPMAAERLLLAQLLVGRGRGQEALDVADSFDRALIANLVHWRASLEVRARAAVAVGRLDLVRAYRDRLRTVATSGVGAAPN